MNDVTLIPVTPTHRISIVKCWNSGERRWGWKVIPEELTDSFFFWKSWVSSSWENNGDWFFIVTTYYDRDRAFKEAERLKSNYLAGLHPKPKARNKPNPQQRRT